MNSFIRRLSLFIIIMLSGAVQAADDQLRMITATGRAVIAHSDALNEAKNAALEEAILPEERVHRDELFGAQDQHGGRAQTRGGLE